MTDKHSEIAIIGGGLAGLTTAWSLQKEGYANATILEKGSDTTMEASGLNAGLIRHYHESARIRRELRRGISLLSSYQTRHNTYFFDQKPSLWRVSKERYLALEQEQPEHLQWHRTADEDVPARFHTDNTGEEHCWISFEDDALLDSRTLGKLLRDEVEHSSVQIRTNASVKSGKKTDDQWTLTLEDGEETSADLIVNAAGAWANDINKRLTLAACKMTPVPRQLFLLENDLVPDALSYVMDREKQIILRRAEEGTLVSFADEQEDDLPDVPAAESYPDDYVNDRIGSHFPRLDFAPIKSAWVGRYAKTPDRKPIIEPHPDDRTVIQATGLNDYGLSYGFHVGEKVVEFL